MSEHIDPGLVKYRWYRPADPVFVSVSEVMRCRESLKALDPKLDIWWNADWKNSDTKQPGRWAIMYWMERSHHWGVVKYWETAGGDFRPMTIDCVEQIKRELAEIDADKSGQDVKSVNRLADKLEQERKQKKHIESVEALREFTNDMMERNFGVRQTFAPGYIRRRSVKASDLSKTNHALWLRSKGIVLP